MRSTLLVTMLLVLSAGGATADDRNRDCSKLKKWNYDRQYKRGDTVWYNAGGNYGAEYKCTKDTCNKAEPNLSSGRDSWTSLGTCAAKPSGVSADVQLGVPARD
jgi:hypothetical protein